MRVTIVPQLLMWMALALLLPLVHHQLPAALVYNLVTESALALVNLKHMIFHILFHGMVK